MKCSAFVLAIALLACVPATAYADSDTVLQGHIYTFAEHNPIANAKIWIVSHFDSRSVLTNASGRFTVFGLEPGTYTVLVHVDGYASGTVAGVQIVPGETAFVGLPLIWHLLDGSTRGYSVRDGCSYVVP